MTEEKPVVVRLDISDLRRSVDDPALRALLEKGWTALTSVVIESQEGQFMYIVLRPPVPPVVVQAPTPVVTAPPQEHPWWLYALVAVWSATALLQLMQ